MTPNHETSVYVSTGVFELAERRRWMNGAPPRIYGVAEDLGRLLAEERRRAITRVRDRAESPVFGHGWGAHSEFEREWEQQTNVYRLPLNTMISARKAKSITGFRRQPGAKPGEGYAVWGLLDVPLSDHEVAELRERKAYRERNRDKDDPLKAFVNAVEKKLPKPKKNARPLYLAYEYEHKLWNRSIGVFDSYDAAVHAAPKEAIIVEIPADGHTSDDGGKLLRGHFPSGWGYASGYAPADREKAINA